LYKYSFIREHENIYFSKDLSQENNYSDTEITFEILKIGNAKEKINFLINNEVIGYCEFAFLHNNISYMYIIEIVKEYRNQKLGTRCMKIIFKILKEKGILKLDLDTLDSNYIAQKFYTNLGFKFNGITRSYSIDKDAPTSHNKR
jgi:ribosomal protein S18 acetylase RimI-like enzyme